MSNSHVSFRRATAASEGDLRLPKPPGAVRRFWGRHPWFTDSLIAALYGAPVFVGTMLVPNIELSTNVDPSIAFLAPLFAVLSIVAVLLRRRIPLIALSLATVSAAVLTVVEAGFLDFGVCLLLYAVAVYRSNRAAWIGLAASGTVLFASSLVMFPSPLEAISSGHASVTSVVFLTLATLIGVNAGNSKRYLAALIDRAEQLASERDQQAQLATAAERARIAREMHDIVSHSLTVMVSLADGSAALIGSDPARSEDAMRRSAETGRHALTDMRRMLGVLDDDSVPAENSLAPQPGTSDIASLIDTFRAAGLPIHSTIVGDAPIDPGRQLAVYRTVQESLTNALRYAPDATKVEVDIRYSPTKIVVTMTDDGLGLSASDHGPGRGLVGIGERVSLYGGSVTSGTHGEHGWRMRAEFSAVDGGES